MKADRSVADVRVVRVFISSTFRDFGEERDLLVKRVFPELRRRARERFVEVVGVDLRWGITEEESQRGETLSICLREIERARPHFICLLGERYGWTPTAGQYSELLMAQQPWLAEHAGVKSLTELEVLHGVLNAPEMAGRASFYFRDSAYAAGRGPDFASEGAEERAKLARLKDRIRAGPFPVMEYGTPEEVAARITDDLWKLMDAEYPADAVPDALERERRSHEAYSAQQFARHVGLHRKTSEAMQRLLGERPVARTTGRLIVVAGDEGCGKTAMTARLVEVHRSRFPADLVLVHHAESSESSGEIRSLLARLLQFCAPSTSPMQGGVTEMSRALPAALASLALRAKSMQVRALLVLDGVDKVSGPDHLPWLPRFIPEGIDVLATCASGAVREVLEPRADAVFRVEPMDPVERKDFLESLLSRSGKRLPASALTRIVAHHRAGNPLFLATVVEELEVAARHETLEADVGSVCSADDVDDLLERRLARVEQDLGWARVSDFAVALATSRSGLAEAEVMERAGLSPLDLARIEASLGSGLRNSTGLLALAGAHAMRAVMERYGLDEATLMKAHEAAADAWISRGPSRRGAFEAPWQLERAECRQRLREILLDRSWVDCILEHRGEEELQRAWMAVAPGHPLHLVSEYEAAADAWARKDLPLHRGSFPNRLCGFLSFAAGPSEFSRRLLAEAVAEGRSAGVDDAELAIRLNNLGHEELELGMHDAAIRSFSESLALRDRCLPEGHPHALGTLDNLGGAFRELGEWSQAIAHYRRALDLRTRHLGRADADTATSQNNLAMTLLALPDASERDFEEARMLLESAYRTSIDALGARHPDTAISAGNLGLFHLRHGDLVEARRLLEHALATHLEALGPTHPYVRVGRARLEDFPLQQGVRLRESGSLDEAERVLGHELERRAQAYGTDSLQWASCASALGECHVRRGGAAIARARTLLEASLANRARVLGIDHDLTKIVRGRLAALDGSK